MDPFKTILEMNNRSQLTDISTQTILKSNTIVLLGDSLTLRNGYGSEKAEDESANNYYVNDGEGFFTWGNVLLSHRFNMIKNLGVGGERTDNILLRIGDVLALSPSYCHVLAGTNDVGQDIPSATIISNIQSIVEALVNGGITIIVGTIFPRTTLTSGRLNILLTVNDWIRSYCANHSGCICVDYYSVLAKAADGLAKTGVLIDGTHQGPRGAYLGGTIFYDTLKDIIPNVSILPYADSPTNLLGNAMFTGDTGGIATGWTIGGTGRTPSKVASSTNIDAEWQKISIASGAPAIYREFTSAIGSSVYGVIEFALENVSSFTNLHLEISLLNSSFENLGKAYDLWVRDSNRTAITEMSATKSGVLKTPTITIPVGAAQAIFKLTAILVGDLSIRRAGVYAE